MDFKKRLKKEFEELSLRPPAGITLDQDAAEDNFDV